MRHSVQSDREVEPRLADVIAFPTRHINRDREPTEEIPEPTAKEKVERMRAYEVRKRRGRANRLEISVVPVDGRRRTCGEFVVQSPSSDTSYHVEIRSTRDRHNTCTCPDHRVNGLGTCKHVEAALRYARNRWPGDFQRVTRTGSPRIELFVDRSQPDYVVRLLLPESPLGRGVRPHVTDFLEPDHALSGDPLSSLPLLTRTLDALPQDVRSRVRVSTSVKPFIDHLAMQVPARWLDELLAAHNHDPSRVNPLQTKLYPYQEAGMLHLARKGRAVLADDMGLGKTIQAIAAAELMRSVGRVHRVLVICPASVKPEWEDQLLRFSGHAGRLVNGNPEQRAAQYAARATYTITNYEQVRRDIDLVNEVLAPDLVIFDEAQKFKNRESLTARRMKQLRSRYAFVLTGTPLENRVEELYSILQVVDPHLLGPLFHFNHRFCDIDGDDRFHGYRNLDELYRLIQPVMLRRRKSDVEHDLPGRTDEIVFVRMSRRQRDLYARFEMQVQILLRSAGDRTLTPAEVEELQRLLACMRMVCDTPYILDEKVTDCPKLFALEEALQRNLDRCPHTKIVLFSEWERMLRLVAHMLDDWGLDYAWHTGSVPQMKRRAQLNRFKHSDSCRILLSTDSGATGLNLQVASVVVNLDLPWNPARLEQRIARAWRKFQNRSVRVINLVSEGTIEDRMLDVLARKTALSETVLDGKQLLDRSPEERRATFMEKVEELMAPEPNKPQSGTTSLRLPLPSAMPAIAAASAAAPAAVALEEVTAADFWSPLRLLARRLARAVSRAWRD